MASARRAEAGGVVARVAARVAGSGQNGRARGAGLSEGGRGGVILRAARLL